MGGSSLRHSTLATDSDPNTRGPPPVQEGRELVDEPYTVQEDEEEKHYQDLLNEHDHQEPIKDSREISEETPRPDTHRSQSLTIETYDNYEKDSNPTPILNENHGFDFGADFGQSPFNDGFQLHEDPSMNVPSVAIAPPSTSGSQESRGSHASPPSGQANTQQRQQYSGQSPTNTNGNQSWNSSSSRPESTDEWPQEALLYQSRYDTYDSNGHAGQEDPRHRKQSRGENDFNVF